jgi:iron complex transport system permease protein
MYALKLNTKFLIIISLMLLGILFIVSLIYGAADISFSDVLALLDSNAESKNLLILKEIRLPREVGAMIIGIGLATSGAMIQGLTKNPLADPGLLGLSAGAKTALTLALIIFPGLSYIQLIIAGIFGATLGALLVFGIIVFKKGKIDPFRTVLAGAAISAFLHAITQGLSLYFRLSKEVAMWSSGGLIGINWEQVKFVSYFIIPCFIIGIIFSKQLSILSLDEEVSKGLGQNIPLMQKLFFVLIVIMTGASVALAGNIAFLGLLIPHIVRSFVGYEYKRVLPLSGILGAAFMLSADTIARVVNAPYETSIAAVISFIGLPFFLWIVYKGRWKQV